MIPKPDVLPRVATRLSSCVAPPFHRPAKVSPLVCVLLCLCVCVCVCACVCVFVCVCVWNTKILHPTGTHVSLRLRPLCSMQSVWGKMCIPKQECEPSQTRAYPLEISQAGTRLDSVWLLVHVFIVTWIHLFFPARNIRTGPRLQTL